MFSFFGVWNMKYIILLLFCLYLIFFFSYFPFLFQWHALSREEQAKYYELARKERQLHMQLYPGWSARDNYGKKKKRKREKLQESTSGTGPRMTAAYIWNMVENGAHSPRAKPRQRPRDLFWRWKLVENLAHLHGLPSGPQRRLPASPWGHC